MNPHDEPECCIGCTGCDESEQDPYECQREADAVRDDAERDRRLGK